MDNSGRKSAKRLSNFPLAAAAGPEIFENYDKGFDEGLQLVIAGIKARYANASDKRRPA